MAEFEDVFVLDDQYTKARKRGFLVDAVLSVTENNCGTGAGGFKPGNKCAKGSAGKLPAPVGYTEKKGRHWYRTAIRLGIAGMGVTALGAAAYYAHKKGYTKYLLVAASTTKSMDPNISDNSQLCLNACPQETYRTGGFRMFKRVNKPIVTLTDNLLPEDVHLSKNPKTYLSLGGLSSSEGLDSFIRTKHERLFEELEPRLRGLPESRAIHEAHARLLTDDMGLTVVMYNPIDAHFGDSYAHKVNLLFTEGWPIEGGSSSISLALRSRVNALFGGSDSSKTRLTPEARELLSDKAFVAATDAYAKSCYKTTQRLLKENGVERLILFRGDNISRAKPALGKEFKEFIKQSSMKEGTHLKTFENIPISMRSLSSYALDYLTTDEYGFYANYEFKKSRAGLETNYSAVSSVLVPRQKVFSSFLNGPGDAVSTEFLLLGGKYKSNIAVEVTTGDPKPSPRRNRGANYVSRDLTKRIVQNDSVRNNCGTGAGGFKPGNRCAKGNRSTRGKKYHVPSTGEVQKLSNKFEKKLVKKLGLKHIGSNLALDGLSEDGKLGVEIKVIHRGKISRTQMRRDSRLRKEEWQKMTEGSKFFTIVIDNRARFATGDRRPLLGGSAVYYREGIGAFRFGRMHRADNLKQLKKGIGLL